MFKKWARYLVGSLLAGWAGYAGGGLFTFAWSIATDTPLFFPEDYGKSYPTWLHFLPGIGAVVFFAASLPVLWIMQR